MVDGSDDDRMVGVDVLDDGDEVDFNTDSSEEVQSDHDDEYYEWQQSAVYNNELRTNPDLARYGNGVRWHSPRDRTSVADVTNCPEQSPRFNATLEGERPYLRLFLQGLPLRSFWQRIVVREILRYAEQEMSQPGGATPTQRTWDPEKCTVANLLRCVAGVIQRGLENCADDPEFFESQRRGRQYRQGFTETSGLRLNLYQQLMRMLHLVNNHDKPDPYADDYDKLYKVRPLLNMLQKTWRAWYVPGRDHGFDEAGFPSRFTWLRCFNKTKPNRYFIEALMACCSETRFCWGMFINEGTKRTILRQNRRAGQSKYVKVPHYQFEYDQTDRDIQDKWGPTAAHMHYFARQLRAYDPQPDLPPHSKDMTYRFFCDKRWCSLPGMVIAKEKFDVAFTSTIRKKSRYHAVHQLPVPYHSSKPRKERGKYRSATATFRATGEGEVDTVINCVLWSDSKLVACASADLGTAQMMDYRQQGRHKHAIPIPKMIVVRGKKFRAVDQNDQLRMGKNKFVFICKRKPWPKVFWGGIELHIINVYIIVVELTPGHPPSQRMYRWTLVDDLLALADELDEAAATTNANVAAAAAANAAAAVPATPLQVRHSPDSVTRHHWRVMHEYVTPAEVIEELRMMNDNPNNYIKTSRGNRDPRQRDVRRRDGKVRSPTFFNGLCVVCWAQGKTKKTNKYCHECSLDRSWTYKTRGDGYTLDFHPRLCSRKCWDLFHTSRVCGLDFQHRKRFRRNRQPPPAAAARHQVPPEV